MAFPVNSLKTFKVFAAPERCAWLIAGADLPVMRGHRACPAAPVKKLCLLTGFCNYGGGQDKNNDQDARFEPSRRFILRSAWLGFTQVALAQATPQNYHCADKRGQPL